MTAVNIGLVVVIVFHYFLVNNIKMDAISSSHAGFNRMVFIHITLQTCFI